MVGECVAAAATAAEAGAGQQQEHLVVKPLGDSVTKPLEQMLLLTCEVTGAIENTNYDIKWFGPTTNEIVDRSGRSVIVDIPSAFVPIPYHSPSFCPI